MGSLKNEMKSPTEDNVSGDSTQDGACSLVNSDTRAVPERPKSPDCLVQIYVSIDCGDEGAGAATTGDPDSSAAAGGCGDIDVPLASCRGRDCAETATEPPSLENEVTSTAQTQAVQDARPDSTQGAPNQLPKSEITRADASAGTLEEQSELGEKEEQGWKEDKTECVTSTLDSLGPSSPAPVPKQHIHTQVSLEVVQCHSVATSPMTPPEVGTTGTFFFPLSCGINDTDTQVGRQVEYRSVATAPMTPRTPTTPAGFLATIASERKQKPTEKTASCGETEQAVESGSSPGEGGLPLEPTPVLKAIPSKEETQAIPSQESFTDCPKTDIKALCNSEAAVEEDKQPSKQYGQRMGSMEQDITILVTHYDGPDAEDGEAVTDEVESSAHSTQPELGKINECEEHGSGAVTSEVSVETTRTESENGKVASGQKVSATGNSNGVNLIDSKPKSKEPSPTVIENIRADDPSLKSCLNESQALSEDGELDEKKPFGGSKEPGECSPSQASRQEQKIHTQVSLEVVQCHSVATSPMTPPQEGATGTFFFPSSSVGRKKGAETQDAEMQVGRMVEYRSVATAPMTPRTPTSPSCFPEFTGRGRCQSGKKIEEKLVEEKEEAENRADGENKEQEEPQEEQQEKRVDDKANNEGEGEEKTERKTIETKTEDQREEEKKTDKAVELKEEVQRKVNGKKDCNQDKKVTEKLTEKEENKTGGKETATLNEDPLAERTTTHSKGIAPETVPQIKQERKTTEEERGEKPREKSAGKGDQEKGGETKEEKRNGVAEETTAEEPVQEVRWDEKGMTWEVYGAVVEVAVLGTAIQKHLEKQVKKQKKDSASILPPPPPLNPSAVPPPSTPPPPPPTSGCSQRGSGKGRACKKSEREGKRGRRSRRNPFRLLLQNIQQPHCCARAHSTE